MITLVLVQSKLKKQLTEKFAKIEVKIDFQKKNFKV
jgi:hypothetical protein